MIDPIARTVLQMMSRYGGPAKLLVTSEGEYDYETSTAVNAEKRYPLRVMVFDYLPKTSGMGTGDMLIQAGDKQMFIKPDPTVPVPKARIDSIVHQGRKYNIVVVKELNPSGTNPLLYELFVRV